MVPQGILDSIRERISIVDLVGEYVQLKKSGQAFQGLCPFHSEKTPSFYVHPVKQVFRCFGCQKGGNAFTFLMEMESLSFPEAVERLADRTGVRLEHVASDRNEVRAPKPERALEALKWAARYFNHLLKNVPDYAFARDYLQARGVSPASIDQFYLGVAPKGWETLLNQMQKRGFQLHELVEAGLVVERESRSGTGGEAGGYDRFRERLIFPIRDRQGRVVGFGARALKDGDEPKYLNSSESELFSKRRLLYGLYEAQRGIRQSGEAILVEGYMDVIGLHQAGVTHAVATMGTAFTQEHCAELRPLTRRVVTVFDPDRAGQDAWQRSVHLLLEAGFFARDLLLPDGLDPDEYVQKHGKQAFETLCVGAPRQVTKLLRSLAQQAPLSEAQVTDTLTRLTPLLLATRRSTERAVLWDDISRVLGISVPVLRELAEGAARGASPRGVQAPRPQISARRGALPAGPHPVDLSFFTACVETPEFLLQTPKEFWEPGLVDPTIKQWLLELAQSSTALEFREKLGTLVHSGGPSVLVAAAAAGVFERPGAGGRTRAEFDALVKRIQYRAIEAEIKSLSAQVKLEARMNDPEQQLQLLARLRELRAQNTGL